MHLPTVLFSLVFATLGLGYQHGEIPSNVAVRSNGNGVIEFFHEADRRAFEASQAAKRQATDPQSDTYPVANDESGVKPFRPADAELVAAPAKRAIGDWHEGQKRQGGADQAAKRQATDPQSDTYPVANDESGVKPFRPADADLVAAPATAAKRAIGEWHEGKQRQDGARE